MATKHITAVTTPFAWLSGSANGNAPATNTPAPGGGESAFTGVSLCAHLRGLTVIYRDGTTGDITTQTTTNYGATWYEATVTAESDGYGVAPSLAVSRHEDLFAAYHTELDAVRVFRSQDYAETWEEVTTSPALTGRYPRLLFTGDRAFLLYWDTGAEEARLYASSDHFETLTQVATLAQSEQVNAFGMDRRGRLHILAEDGGTIVAYESWDGETWEGPDSFIGGREGPPGCAYWLHRGAILAWNADMLQLYATDSGFVDLGQGPWDVTDAYPVQSPGICFDRRGYLFIALEPAAGGFSVETDIYLPAQVAPDMPDIPQFAIDEDP